MDFQTLIDAEQLHRRLDDPEWVIVDCRFSLDNPERGRREYAAAHIPGAVYAHLDHDLSGRVVPGVTGRHPLPEIETFSQKLSGWGVGSGVQVIAYDDSGGAIAARLWWLLQYLGHEPAAVLDGGWQAWQAAGHPTQSGTHQPIGRKFRPRLRPELLVTTEMVAHKTQDPRWLIVDSRAADRFRGVREPIDPIAGRIPGAVNAPHAGTVADGHFLPEQLLRQRFQQLLGPVPPEHVIFYCGSGVTAARNLLGMAHAGLGLGRLYAGSWSEWITDPTRPVERDPDAAEGSDG